MGNEDCLYHKDHETRIKKAEDQGDNLKEQFTKYMLDDAKLKERNAIALENLDELPKITSELRELIIELNLELKSTKKEVVDLKENVALQIDEIKQNVKNDIDNVQINIDTLDKKIERVNDKLSALDDKGKVDFILWVKQNIWAVAIAAAWCIASGAKWLSGLVK